MDVLNDYFNSILFIDEYKAVLYALFFVCNNVFDNIHIIKEEVIDINSILPANKPDNTSH